MTKCFVYQVDKILDCWQNDESVRHLVVCIYLVKEKSFPKILALPTDD